MEGLSDQRESLSPEPKKSEEEIRDDRLDISLDEAELSEVSLVYTTPAKITEGMNGSWSILRRGTSRCRGTVVCLVPVDSQASEGLLPVPRTGETRVRQMPVALASGGRRIAPNPGNCPESGESPVDLTSRGACSLPVGVTNCSQCCQEDFIKMRQFLWLFLPKSPRFK